MANIFKVLHLVKNFAVKKSFNFLHTFILKINLRRKIYVDYLLKLRLIFKFSFSVLVLVLISYL